jgi:hypothetical protein
MYIESSRKFQKVSRLEGCTTISSWRIVIEERRTRRPGRRNKMNFETVNIVTWDLDGEAQTGTVVEAYRAMNGLNYYKIYQGEFDARGKRIILVIEQSRCTSLGTCIPTWEQ